MKILVTLDTKQYSQKIIKDVARLAGNTLADVVFLGVQEDGKKPARTLSAALLKYHRDLCGYFGADESPYLEIEDENWQKDGAGWSLSSRGLKEFRLLIRTGSVAQQTLAVAGEVGSDLVILGCSRKFGCEWDGEMNVPLRIARDAPCSVLVIKEVKKAGQIISILDQSKVSQDALELVNQLVTLHDAGLKIVGVKEKRSRKADKIEKKMVELLKYYNEREISAWIKLINADDVQDYVTASSKEGIVALWMGGKESLIKKLFSRSMVDRLLETTRSALLILR
jgi:nucleotide-binding universal stress UspA family protein